MDQHGVAQQELSLEYRYMFVTDIMNCYGSVNLQAFDWAFTLKDTEHERTCDAPIARNIQKILRAFQHGRNVGIPQGSAIFDFVAEIVLGYSDLLLHETLRKEDITSGYEIIRYRDDYRVFCNDKDKLEKISYILQHVLENLNFRMNSKKTKISESIVTDSIKSDKLAYIYNTPIMNNKKECDFDSFEKHLIYILLFSRQYPDSGSVKTMQSDIDKRIMDSLNQKDKTAETDNQKEESAETKENESVKTDNNIFTDRKEYPSRKAQSASLPGGSARAMAAVCTQIAMENPGCCHYALRVLSRIVNAVDDEKKKWDIFDKVCSKLSVQPNSDYIQLWLQYITYQRDKKNGSSPYQVRLCKVVMGDDAELWNCNWLKEDFTKDFQQASIVNAECLKNITPVITFRETRAYIDEDYGDILAIIEKLPQEVLDML